MYFRLSHLINRGLIKISGYSIDLTFHTQKTTPYKFNLTPVDKNLFKVNKKGTAKMPASIVLAPLLFSLNSDLSFQETLTKRNRLKNGQQNYENKNGHLKAIDLSFPQVEGPNIQNSCQTSFICAFLM